jgi:stress-induced-phosphoprotein 1
MNEQEPLEEQEEWQLQSIILKDQGNDSFKRGDNKEAIDFYSKAIEIDPDNHVFYSNRSAAYMKVDYISKALHDGLKCVDLAPKWSKGYNRLGVAQQGLRRFIQAIDTFKKGVTINLLI